MTDILRERFEKNMIRHRGISWDAVAARLQSHPEAIDILRKMEDTGGEPDVIGVSGDSIIFCDCSAESPSGRRRLCYDAEARVSRKKDPPVSSVLEQAEEMGVMLMDEEQYRYLQTVGEFDQKTQSWIFTLPDLREKGGALFCERRYGRVFVFHNKADSFFASRGWRGILIV